MDIKNAIGEGGKGSRPNPLHVSSEDDKIDMMGEQCVPCGSIQIAGIGMRLSVEEVHFETGLSSSISCKRGGIIIDQKGRRCGNAKVRASIDYCLHVAAII